MFTFYYITFLEMSCTRNIDLYGNSFRNSLRGKCICRNRSRLVFQNGSLRQSNSVLTISVLLGERC